MTTAVDPYTFTGGTTAIASQINARFAALFAVVNGEIDSSNLASAIQHALFSAGDLKISAAATAPTGWLLCDGAAYSRTGYAALFGAISTTFGAGDGTSTFNVPDLKGRVPVGAGAGTGLSARTLGAKGGDEGYSSTVLLRSGGTFFASLVQGAGVDVQTGGGTSGNQMQPFTVVNVFIFTGQ